MNKLQKQIIIITLIMLINNTSFAINFNPGNYEVTNWMEIPGQGRMNEERHVECITEKDLKMGGYKESGCTLLSENASGNTIKLEFKCHFSGVDKVSSDITYSGDSFNGTLTYSNDNGSNLNIGIRGKRVSDCNGIK
jgi:hypothetical protein